MREPWCSHCNPEGYEKHMSTSYGPASFDNSRVVGWNTPDGFVPNQPVTTKDSVVDEIQKTVCGPREEAYGGPEDNFQRIANHWNVFLTNRFGVKVGMTAADVSAMMILLKVARLEYKPDHHDSWVDAGGYAVCGAVCAANP